MPTGPEDLLAQTLSLVAQLLGACEKSRHIGVIEAERVLEAYQSEYFSLLQEANPGLRAPSAGEGPQHF